MNICIPTLDRTEMEAKMCDHFGSAPYFTLYNTETKQFVTSINDNTHHEHGSCMPVDALKKQNVEAVLCKGMGARAVNLLQSAGVKAFLVDAETAGDAIKKFDANEVQILSTQNACQSHSCH